MASVTITKQASPVSPEQIKRFEQENGLLLPDSYKNFLLRSNGGEPKPDRLVVPGWRGKSTAVNRFFGLGEGGNYDLETSLHNVEDYVPNGFMPIAEDSGGNLLCLGTTGSQEGKIYFWDHEEADGDDPHNLRELAESIDELLDKLLSPEG